MPVAVGHRGVIERRLRAVTKEQRRLPRIRTVLEAAGALERGTSLSKWRRHPLRSASAYPLRVRWSRRAAHQQRSSPSDDLWRGRGTDKGIRRSLAQLPPNGFACYNGPLIALALDGATKRDCSVRRLEAIYLSPRTGARPFEI